MLVNFYEKYDKQIYYFKKYNNILTFDWKVEYMNINHIYSIIMSTVLHPSYLYEFFDLNFKFVAAAIYYEVNKLYNANEINTKILSNFDLQDLRKLFKYTSFSEYFPANYKELLLYIKSYANYRLNNNMVYTDQSEDIKLIKSNIKDQLTDMGICINMDTPPTVHLIFESVIKLLEFSNFIKTNFMFV